MAAWGIVLSSFHGSFGVFLLYVACRPPATQLGIACTCSVSIKLYLYSGLNKL